MPSTETVLQKKIAKKVKGLSRDHKRLLTSRLMSLTEKTSARLVNDAWTYITNKHVLPEKLVRGARVSNFTPITKLLGSSVYQGIKKLAKVSDLLNVYRFLVVLVADVLKVRIPKSTIAVETNTTPNKSTNVVRKPKKAAYVLDTDSVYRINSYRSNYADLTPAERVHQKRREQYADARTTRNAHKTASSTGPRKKRVERVTWKVMVNDIRDRTLRSRVRRAQEMHEAYNRPNDKYHAVGRINYGAITVEYRRVRRLRSEIENLRRRRGAAITEDELAAVENSISRKLKRITQLNHTIDKLAVKVAFKETKRKRGRH